MKSRYLAGCLAATLGVFGVVSAQQAPQPPAAKGLAAAVGQQPDDSPAARVSRYGKILDARPVGAGGLVAWTVEASNGQSVELYTTADASVVFTGILWDAKTGKNISDAFLPKQTASTTAAPAATAAASGEHKVSALEGKYTGAIPESIKTVASLDGIQEGKGDPSNTVYIIFDPRCHYCHDAYALTRKYVKKGYAIKWIPSLALGDAEGGAPVAASIMQSKSPIEQLNRVMTTAYPFNGISVVKPTKATMEALAKNLSFLFAAFENSHTNGQAGVPVAFYIDHRTGKPTMMPGVSSQVVLNDIFGQI